MSERNTEILAFGKHGAILLSEGEPGHVLLHIRIRGDEELDSEGEGAINLLPDQALALAEQLVEYVDKMEARAWNFYVAAHTKDASLGPIRDHRREPRGEGLSAQRL